MDDFEITEAHRRIANLIQIGVIAEADYGRDRYRVRIGDLLTGWLPILSLRGQGNVHYTSFDAGEQVAVLAPSGELAQGVIIGAIHKDSAPAVADRGNVHRALYADGTLIEYNRKTHHFAMALASGSAEITAPNGITINGDVTVNGDVVASGVSLVDHVHTAVMPGAALSGKPDN